MAPNHILDILSDARRIIDTRGWIQHQSATADGYCASGAIEESLVYYRKRAGGLWRAEVIPMYLTRAIAYLNRDFWNRNGHWAQVINWNDERGRTKDEVLLMFDTAIRLAIKDQK